MTNKKKSVKLVSQKNGPFCCFVLFEKKREKKNQKWEP